MSNYPSSSNDEEEMLTTWQTFKRRQEEERFRQENGKGVRKRFYDENPVNDDHFKIFS